MRRTYLMAALALAATAAPAALATSGDVPKQDPPKNDRPADLKGKGPKGTHYLLRACVIAPGASTGVDLGVLGGNRHMRRALDGATTFTAKIDANTVIRLVGRARHLPEGSDPKRLPKIGTYADLQPGDWLTVRFRAPRGTKSADLPAAFKIIDHGPSKKCAAPKAPDPKPPADQQPGL
jgi:hypothetical protein